MTTALVVVSVGDGTELDRLTLDDEGRIAFRTGVARDMVEAWRARIDAGDDTDTELLAALAGWSNGYVAVRPAGEAGPEDQADTDNAGGEPAGGDGG